MSDWNRTIQTMLADPSMTAPVSPIATQEPPEATARRIAGSWGNYSAVPMLVEAIKAERSSAERRVEELGRERDGWKADAETQMRANNLYREALDERNEFKNRMRAAEALVTTLKAEVEELKRKLTKVLDERATLRDMHEAAESRLAFLTGRVEDMRAALTPFAKLADDDPDPTRTKRMAFLPIAQLRAARAAIRSLPVLPTTGDGGGLNRRNGNEEKRRGDGCQILLRAPWR